MQWGEAMHEGVTRLAQSDEISQTFMLETLIGAMVDVGIEMRSAGFATVVELRVYESLADATPCTRGDIGVIHLPVL
jgi:hypothetical protein